MLSRSRYQYHPRGECSEGVYIYIDMDCELKSATADDCSEEESGTSSRGSSFEITEIETAGAGGEERTGSVARPTEDAHLRGEAASTAERETFRAANVALDFGQLEREAHRFRDNQGSWGQLGFVVAASSDEEGDAPP